MEAVLGVKAKIMTLLLKEPMFFKALQDASGFSNVTITRSVPELEEAGLVTVYGDSEKYRRKYVKLTAKGQRVAEHLEAIRKIIEGD